MPVDLVGVGVKNGINKLNFYKVNAGTRLLEKIGSIPLTKPMPNGSCMYHSPVTGKYYYFVNWQDGAVQQWELDGSSGAITGTLVRGDPAKSPFNIGGHVEGCVADDVNGVFYIARESDGIYKYGAEPGDSTLPIAKVDSCFGSTSHLRADVEGLTIYYESDGTGYLIA